MLRLLESNIQKKMKILVDADACPVVEITINLAKKYNYECILVCDTSHVINRTNAKTVTVDTANDSADFKLVNMTDKGDVVVTGDYGLAAMCLSRCAIVLNHNGLIYNSENIDNLLFSRSQITSISSLLFLFCISDY